MRTHNEQHAETHNGKYAKIRNAIGILQKKKKKNAEFPEHDKHWHDMLFQQLKWDFETKKCHMVKWYTCLHDKYRKYMKQKQNNGFFPQSGKNRSLMLKNNMKFFL